ncbi:MAG: O-methyltransferase [Bacilli bacterium]|nr:O-methyltransferase [Bacilli bacterium]
MDNYIRNMEEYAHSNNIPIMLPDGIEFLCNYIRDNNINSILEIGTAIGYSAIKMAMVNDKIKITTIERDKERYDMAVNNINNCNLSDRITVIYGDAIDIDVKDKFDLLFIDASKGHNIDFFERYKHNLYEDGVIVTDNLSFHGLVEDSEKAITKNQKGLVRKIKNFIEFLDNNKEYDTIYVNVGDKISISKKNSI